MGNSNSAELLSIPLQSPVKPIRALDVSWVSQSPTRLHIKVGCGTSAVVTDLATNQAVYTFKDKILSSRTFLKDPHGQILVTSQMKAFSGKCRIFQGDQTETSQFEIHDISGLFKTMVLVVEFVDRKTGTQCRVAIKGSASTKVVLCYLELGSPSLSQLGNSKDFEQNQARYQPIGRIQREHTGFTHEEFSIDAAAGVDLTLLLLMWQARYAYLQAERTSATTSG